jgi:hypothetical protein
MIRWVNFGDDISATGQGAPTIFGHVVAQDVAAVGAIPASTPTVAESFSSLGGAIPIDFAEDGTPLPTPELRIKPEYAAPDGVQTTFFEAPPPNNFFFGTSAAAPHAAGLAALLLQQRTLTTPAEMTAHLEATAIPIAPATVTGAGLIQAAPFGPVTLPQTVAPDNLEPNQVTTQTTFLGYLPNTAQTIIGNVGVQVTPAGLPDYDNYRWTATQNGTFTATLATNSELEIHLFTIVNGVLKELTNDTTAGATTRQVTAGFQAGQTIIVEIKGRPLLPSISGTGDYSLSVTFG